MRQSLKDFICEWNRAHWHFFFAMQEAPVVERPVSIEIRYWAVDYQDFSTEQWNLLKNLVEENPHGMMYISSNEDFFKRGVVEIKITSANHEYREDLVVETLRRIGEEFSPKTER